jgi:hypothetical protein
MFEILFQRYPALIVPVIALLGTTIVFTVWIIAHYMHALRRQELEASMKQDMLARGFATDEIERVLSASNAKPASVSEKKESITDNEYYLVEKMLEEGHAIEDIERLVRAFKEKNGTRASHTDFVTDNRG